MSKKHKYTERRPITSGVIWLCIGLYLLALSNNWIPRPNESWPLLLVIIGVALIAKAFFRRGQSAGSENPHSS